MTGEGKVKPTVDVRKLHPALPRSQRSALPRGRETEPPIIGCLSGSRFFLTAMALFFPVRWVAPFYPELLSGRSAGLCSCCEEPPAVSWPRARLRRPPPLWGRVGVGGSYDWRRPSQTNLLGDGATHHRVPQWFPVLPDRDGPVLPGAMGGPVLPRNLSATELGCW